MGARRGRIAIVLGPIIGLLLLLVARQTPRPAGDVVPGPVTATAVAAGPAVPVPAPSTSADQAGSVPRPVTPDAAAPSGCPGPNALHGLCGSVAGFAGFYGSWKTAGAAGAFCLQHAKREPQAGLSYTKYPTAAGHTAMTGESRLRLGYLLSRYGGTGDTTKAAALAILAHASVGDSLTTDQLGSYPTSLPAAVRSAVVSLWAEAAAEHGPYTASVAIVGVGSGAKATLTVRSAAGQPMAGFPVSWAGSSHGDETDTTGSDGTATLTVASVAPGNTFTAHAAVGGLPAGDVGVWVPSDDTVQTVAVPLSDVSATADTTWTAAPTPATLTLRKSTTDPAYVSPAGATFRVTDAAGRAVGTLRADASGASNVIGLTASDGPFTVTETAPCDQCLAAPPQVVTLTPGQAGTVAFTDGVVPVRLLLEKVDPSGAALSGAVLHVRRASQPGGAFDTDLGTCTTGPGGCAVTGQDTLPPGDYEVTEDAPAPGTSWSVPRAQTVSLRRGSATLVFTDPRLTTVSFLKTADPSAGIVDPAHESLAGAVFAVSGPALPTGSGADPTVVELGRCVTAADGSCAIPGTPLVEGNPYMWQEISAPPGFALDPATHPFTACVAPCPAARITAVDAGRYAEVTLLKHVAGDTSTTVAGALVDLCATGLPDAVAATYAAPAGAACPPATTWVASGTTDAHGAIDFGSLPPGAHYCAVERAAPAGFELNPQPVCGDIGAAGSLADPAPAALALDLADARTPVPPETPAPPAAPSPPAPSSPAPVVTLSPPVVPTPAARRPVRVLPTVVQRPPVTDTPPTVPPAPLAYTGVEHVGGLLELGSGLVLLGLALLSGFRRRETG